jgi:hypothetical protein
LDRCVRLSASSQTGATCAGKGKINGMCQTAPFFLQKRNKKRAGRKYRPIWDRQFVSFIQFYLHKCGQLELGKLIIKYPIDGNDADKNDAVLFKVYQYNQYSRALPLTDAPMPENIKNFKEIDIRLHFAFLIKIFFFFLTIWSSIQTFFFCFLLKITSRVRPRIVL